jgi:hypothetical protein
LRSPGVVGEMSDPLLTARDLALVDAVAERVLELVAERGAPRGRSPLVSAGELAEILGTSRDYVYRHADDLGAVRLGGDGPRSEHGGSRLRFDVEKAIAAQSARQASESSQTADPPAGAGNQAGRRRRSVERRRSRPRAMMSASCGGRGSCPGSRRRRSTRRSPGSGRSSRWPGSTRSSRTTRLAVRIGA